jgi:hypothetical protein
MPMYQIVQKKNHNAVYAKGCWDMQRAQQWIDNYNPNMYVDKTVQKEDLEIIEEPAYQLRRKRRAKS